MGWLVTPGKESQAQETAGARLVGGKEPGVFWEGPGGPYDGHMVKQVREEGQAQGGGRARPHKQGLWRSSLQEFRCREAGKGGGRARQGRALLQKGARPVSSPSAAADGREATAATSWTAPRAWLC